MSKVIRFVLLAAVLSIAFLPRPVHAAFNSVCYLTSGNLPPIRMQADGDGGVTFTVETPNGEGASSRSARRAAIGRSARCTPCRPTTRSSSIPTAFRSSIRSTSTT